MKVLTHLEKDKSTEKRNLESWYQLSELQNSQVQVLTHLEKAKSTELWYQLPEFHHSEVLPCLEKDKSTAPWYQLPELQNSEKSTASVVTIENEHNYSKDNHGLNFIPEIYSELLELPKIENEQHEVSSAVQALQILLCEETEESDLLNLEDFQDNKIIQQHTILSNQASTVLAEQWLCEVCGWVLGSRQALRKHIKTQHLYPSKFSRKRVGIIIPKEKSEEKLNIAPTPSTTIYQAPRTKNVSPRTVTPFSNSFDQILDCTVEVSTTVNDKSSRISLIDMVPDSTTDNDTLVTLYKSEGDSSSGPKKTCFCDVCGKGFVNKYVLTTHKSFHTGIRPFSCRYCCKPFKTKGQVQTHERRHLKEEESVEAVKEGESENTTVDIVKKDICDLCGQSFVNKYVLATHKKFHSGIKPYNCGYCEKSFKTKGQMKAHENRHEK